MSTRDRLFFDEVEHVEPYQSDDSGRRYVALHLRPWADRGDHEAVLLLDMDETAELIGQLLAAQLQQLQQPDTPDAHTAVCASGSPGCDDTLYDMGDDGVRCAAHGGGERNSSQLADNGV